MKTKLMRNKWVSVTLVTMLASVLGVCRTTAATMQSSQPLSENFSWSAELVALDESARIITVKVPVVGEQAPVEFGRFKAGERIMLGWSGYDKYSDAVNRAFRNDGTKKAEDRFVFPAEFVSFDTSRKYVTFKVAIPPEGVANLKALKPGEWITATSPHGQKSATQPILAIRPYVSSSGSNSN